MNKWYSKTPSSKTRMARQWVVFIHATVHNTECRPMYHIFHVGLLMFVPAMVQFHSLNISCLAAYLFAASALCVTAG